MIRCANRIANAPVFVSNVLRYVDHADTVAHRHDHIRFLEDFVGDRARERLIRVDAELGDHGAHSWVDLPLNLGAGRVHRHAIFGE